MPKFLTWAKNGILSTANRSDLEKRRSQNVHGEAPFECMSRASRMAASAFPASTRPSSSARIIRPTRNLIFPVCFFCCIWCTTFSFASITPTARPSYSSAVRGRNHRPCSSMISATSRVSPLKTAARICFAVRPGYALAKLNHHHYWTFTCDLLGQQMVENA